MSKKKYRANWRLTGLKGTDLRPGDTIELTDAEAAPYVGEGAVLSAVDGKAASGTGAATDDYDTLTVKELAGRAKARDLAAGGKKAELIARLRAADAEAAGPTE